MVSQEPRSPHGCANEIPLVRLFRVHINYEMSPEEMLEAAVSHIPSCERDISVEVMSEYLALVGKGNCRDSEVAMGLTYISSEPFSKRIAYRGNLVPTQKLIDIRASLGLDTVQPEHVLAFLAQHNDVLEYGMNAIDPDNPVGKFDSFGGPRPWLMSITVREPGARSSLKLRDSWCEDWNSFGMSKYPEGRWDPNEDYFLGRTNF